MMIKKNTKKYNILILGPDRRRGGGIATVIQHLFCDELKKKFRLYYIPTQVNGNRWIKFLQVFKAMFLFWKFNLTRQIDLIHIHSASGTSYFCKSLFMISAKLIHKKVILHIHGGAFYDFYNKCPAAAQWYLRKTMNLADVVITLSDEWSKKFGTIIDPFKLKVIPNPVQVPDELMPKPTNGRRKKILFMGNIVEKKGVYDLVTVAERLTNRIKNIKFILVGSGDIEPLRALIESKGLSEYFELPGWTRDKEPYYKEADIFVLPSYVEALPMVILEAASYGLPIIATTVGAIPEIIESEKSGFLLEPGYVDGFTEKLEMLLQDDQMRRKIGQSARQQILSQCAKGKIMSQLEHLYYSLISRPL